MLESNTSHWFDQDINVRKYDYLVQQIRSRKLILLQYVMQYPYLELKSFTFKYNRDMDDKEEGVRYNFYMRSLMDIILDLFEGCHCEKYPKDACGTICDACILRMLRAINVERYMYTHMSWWLVHSGYYIEKHPVFSQFIDQVVHENLDAHTEELEKEKSEFK